MQKAHRSSSRHDCCDLCRLVQNLVTELSNYKYRGKLLYVLWSTWSVLGVVIFFSSTKIVYWLSTPVTELSNPSTGENCFMSSTSPSSSVPSSSTPSSQPSSSVPSCEPSSYPSGSPSSQPSMENCTVGEYRDLSSGRCHLCPLGTANPKPNMESIKACEACGGGRYSGPSLGASECFACPAGTQQPSQRAIHAASCRPCAEGFSSHEGASTCKRCPGGTFQSHSGAGGCVQCPLGSTSLPGNVECQLCPPGTRGGSWNLARDSACDLCPA